MCKNLMSTDNFYVNATRANWGHCMFGGGVWTLVSSFSINTGGPEYQKQVSRCLAGPDGTKPRSAPIS
jgi:hypothetical protein